MFVVGQALKKLIDPRPADGSNPWEPYWPVVGEDSETGTSSPPLVFLNRPDRESAQALADALNAAVTANAAPPKPAVKSAG